MARTKEARHFQHCGYSPSASAVSTAVLRHSVFWLGIVCFLLICVSLKRLGGEQPPGLLCCITFMPRNELQVSVLRSRQTEAETLIKPKVAMANTPRERVYSKADAPAVERTVRAVDSDAILDWNCNSATLRHDIGRLNAHQGDQSLAKYAEHSVTHGVRVHTANSSFETKARQRWVNSRISAWA